MDSLGNLTAPFDAVDKESVLTSNVLSFSLLKSRLEQLLLTACRSNGDSHWRSRNRPWRRSSSWRGARSILVLLSSKLFPLSRMNQNHVRSLMI